MYFWLVSLSFSFSIGLTSVVHLYFIFWWIGIHSLRKPNDTQTTKVWTKKRHRKWSQDKWDQNLTHQNKTIQLTLAIHSDGPGSKLYDQDTYQAYYKFRTTKFWHCTELSRDLIEDCRSIYSPFVTEKLREVTVNKIMA